MARFLWKPNSESNGNLVVLADGVSNLSLVDLTTGEVLEQGDNKGASNGFGSTVRFSKPGKGYQNIAVVDEQGRTLANIGNGSARVSFDFASNDALAREPFSTSKASGAPTGSAPRAPLQPGQLDVSDIIKFQAAQGQKDDSKKQSIKQGASIAALRTGAALAAKALAASGGGAAAGGAASAGMFGPASLVAAPLILGPLIRKAFFGKKKPPRPFNPDEVLNTPERQQELKAMTPLQAATMTGPGNIIFRQASGFENLPEAQRLELLRTANAINALGMHGHGSLIDLPDGKKGLAPTSESMKRVQLGSPKLGTLTKAIQLNRLLQQGMSPREAQIRTTRGQFNPLATGTNLDFSSVSDGELDRVGSQNSRLENEIAFIRQMNNMIRGQAPSSSTAPQAPQSTAPTITPEQVGTPNPAPPGSTFQTDNKVDRSSAVTNQEVLEGNALSAFEAAQHQKDLVKQQQKFSLINNLLSGNNGLMSQLQAQALAPLQPQAPSMARDKISNLQQVLAS